MRVLCGIAWLGRPCHARGQATRLRVANAARRWSAVKDGWYQSVHHLAMVATKRGSYQESCLPVANAARRWRMVGT
ncbi:MAG: hypothetical protein ACKN81_14345, partial [Pirellulaceae bacterium]